MLSSLFHLIRSSLAKASEQTIGFRFHLLLIVSYLLNISTMSPSL
uniref:Uncharacterized protein n=1 Tax=Podoviridae sp. ctLPy3 TaxID=2825244 RepID=A0A8S5UWE2_9CAUD|nr:MAG TPA: hypothetical protein [Caudoviricetes sp.]DAF98807.1 MAG TPA: hypothetical protein [Podoviridae sp. ctLPy3]